MHTDHKFPPRPARLWEAGSARLSRLPAPGPSLGPGDRGGRQSGARSRATASRSLLSAAEEVGAERETDEAWGGQQRVERGER